MPSGLKNAATFFILSVNFFSSFQVKKVVVSKLAPSNFIFLLSENLRKGWNKVEKKSVESKNNKEVKSLKEKK